MYNYMNAPLKRIKERICTRVEWEEIIYNCYPQDFLSFTESCRGIMLHWSIRMDTLFTPTTLKYLVPYILFQTANFNWLMLAVLLCCFSAPL